MSLNQFYRINTIRDFCNHWWKNYYWAPGERVENLLLESDSHFTDDLHEHRSLSFISL